MIKLAEIFSDNMMLQRGLETIVYGEGDNGKGHIEIQGKKLEFVCENGKFEVILPELKAGDNFDMTICLGNDTRTIKNILVGDVYIAAGQSNMELQVLDTFEIETEDNLNIRYFEEGTKVNGDGIITYTNEGWRICEKEDALRYSAVAYHFAQKLNKKTGVPVGIVSCNKGASGIQTWVSKDITSKPCFAPTMYLKQDKYQLYKFNLNSCLYYNKLLKVVPFTANGILWYQGESNSDVGEAGNYLDMLKELISHWRSLWNKELPFYIVQLMPYLSNPDYSDWAKVRDAQIRASKTIPNVHTVTMVEVSDLSEIHPKNKKCVGEALANAVMNTLFDLKDTEYSGPVAEKCVVTENSVEVTFSHADGMWLDHTWFEDLYIFDGNGMSYEVNGRTADWEIKDDKLIVTWDKDIKPIGIKMGYWNAPKHKLKNSSGYLASPFKMLFSDKN